MPSEKTNTETKPAAAPTRPAKAAPVAEPNQVMAMILGEAAIVTGLGGLAGLVFGAALLLVFARSLGFYFGLLGVPFAWPPFAVHQLAFGSLSGSSVRKVIPQLSR